MASDWLWNASPMQDYVRYRLLSPDRCLLVHLGRFVPSAPYAITSKLTEYEQEDIESTDVARGNRATSRLVEAVPFVKATNLDCEMFAVSAAALSDSVQISSRSECSGDYAGVGTVYQQRPVRLAASSLNDRDLWQHPGPSGDASLLDAQGDPNFASRKRIAALTHEVDTFPDPLTAHNSLASFKAAHAPTASSSQGGCSSDTHRTSSNVDLDFSFEAEMPPYRPAEPLGQCDWTGAPASVVTDRNFVGIDMVPSQHGVPEAQLVRSNSGLLVDAKRERASSAIDLRAQFKAAEVAAAHAQLTALASSADEAENVSSEELSRRAEVREGKRPVEGERAVPHTAPIPSRARFARPADLVVPTASDDHVVLIPEISPPRSAPPRFSETFSSQQNYAREERSDTAQKRTSRIYPLPLRLLQRDRYVDQAHVKLRLGHRHGPTPSESDLDSADPSPLFDSDWEGTARTAPSTPNDTPYLQGCFDPENLASPVPHRSEAFDPRQLGLGERDVGLGLSLTDDGNGAVLEEEAESERDQYPLVPLRGSRRASLPPLPPATTQVRHQTIPSVSISPPSSLAGNQESFLPVGTSSSTLSQDSVADPTISPSRQASCRLPSAVVDPFVVGSTNGAIPSTNTPPPGPAASPNVRTPQHLLVTPTPARFLSLRSPSFSFSPAPLRLVKVQLLRAAGYGTEPATKQETPCPQSGEHTAVAVQGGTVTRSSSTWRDLVDFATSSPTAHFDEVVPAKLILFAGFFLGPWCWLVGGWYLRPEDGEFRSTRGLRCREPDCSCGRILRGSALRTHPAAVAAKNDRAVRVGEQQFAGLDRWIFWNRFAASTSAAVIVALVAVAIWAALTA